MTKPVASPKVNWGWFVVRAKPIPKLVEHFGIVNCSTLPPDTSGQIIATSVKVHFKWCFLIRKLPPSQDAIISRFIRIILE